MIFRSQSKHASHYITEAVPGPDYSRDVLRYVSMLVLSTRGLCFGMLARWSCLLAIARNDGYFAHLHI